MSKILITGANGYIGARLSKFLSENGHQVTGLCYPSAPTDKNWLSGLHQIITGDIREEGTITELSNLDIDCIIHLISLDHNQCNKFPVLDIQAVNVTPTWNLLEKFKSKNLKRLIYFSTFQVYGKIKGNNINEETPANIQNIYGLTHQLSENICNYYHTTTDIDCLSVRLSNSYGSPVFADNNCWWLVINELCKETFESNVIQLKSDGSPFRDFIHSSDVCRAINLLIEKETKTTINTFNLCTGRTYTILELAQMVKSVYKERYTKEIEILLPEGASLKQQCSDPQISRYQIDNSRLKELGFVAQMTIKDGVNELFDYLEKNK
jgi:UDP-glucose 4-epimerase